MKALIATVALISSTTAFASETPTSKLAAQPVANALSVYNIKMALTLNGNLVTTPVVVTKSGEVATVTHESNGEKIIIEVAAKNVRDDKHFGNISNIDKVINMAFTIKRIDFNGEETILARPQITALENEEALISATESNGESYSVKVTADRL